MLPGGHCLLLNNIENKIYLYIKHVSSLEYYTFIAGPKTPTANQVRAYISLRSANSQSGESLHIPKAGPQPIR